MYFGQFRLPISFFVFKKGFGMNINCGNSIYGKVNVLNHHSPLKTKSLNQLSRDTVSFGASVNMSKKIEEYKTYNSGGNHSIRRSEAERIYEYFGFRKKSENTHIKYEGPYGQTVVIKRQNPIDPGAANDLISAIKRADKFNGELILFEGEPSSEQVDNWIKIVNERKPKEGYVNQYAIDFKTQNISEDIQPNEVLQTAKQETRELNDLKKQINVFLDNVSNAENNLSNIESDFYKMKLDAFQDGLGIPKSEFVVVEEQIQSEKERTQSVKETVSSFKEKLSFNKKLSDEEKAQLDDCLKEDFSYQKLKSDIEALEEKYINALNDRDDFYSKIPVLITAVGEKIIDYEIQLEEIKNVLSEALICRCLNPKDSKMIEQAVSKFEQKFNEVKKQVEKQADVDIKKKSNVQLKNMDDNLNSMLNGSLVHLGEELANIQEMVDKKIIPFITYSPAEMEKLRQKRLEDFSKKIAHISVNEPKAGQVETNNQVNAGDETKKSTDDKRDEIEPSLVLEKKSVAPQSEVDATNVEPTLVLERQGEVQKIKTQTLQNTKEMKTLQFKEKLAEKTAPLPIESVKVEMSALIDESFDVDAFANIKMGKEGVQNFVNALVSKIAQTPEYKKLKNATKWALLETMLQNTSNLPEEIYSLPISQLKNIYGQIKTGRKEIEFFTSFGAPVSFKLEKDVDLKKMEQKIGEYNTLIKDIDGKESGLVLDKILSYLPNLSQQENQNLMICLLNEGSYLKLLTDENVTPKARASVLETLLKNYDKTYGTNFAVQGLENFEDEQQRKIAEQVQKKKLDSVDNIDWSL